MPLSAPTAHQLKQPLVTTQGMARRMRLKEPPPPAQATSVSVAEAAADSVVDAAPPPSGSGSEDSADPTSSGSEDVRASELEELSGLVSATEVSTIGLSLGASSGEGEAGGLAGELDMTEPKNYGHSECHQFLGSGRRRKHA